MPQDAYTLKFLCRELNAKFKEGKVNRIIQPSNDEIILTVYTGSSAEKLYISVNPSCPRIGTVSQEKNSPLTAPNFCMLLRKHLLSSKIESISLVGFDRIIKIEFLYSGEFFENVKKTMYVELMGRYSNIILTEDGKILGGNRGINLFSDSVRPLIVGKPYVFPPVSQKKEPTDKSLIDIFNEHAEKAEEKNNVAKTVSDSVMGLAQSTCNEIAEYYEKKYKDKTPDFGENLYNALNGFIDNTVINPCVFYKGDIPTDVFVYPYKTQENNGIKTFDSLITAEDYFFTEKESSDIFVREKERCSAIVNTAIKKIKKKISGIKSKEKDCVNAEENRIKGELILSNIYKINGQDKVVLENYYDSTLTEIVLDRYKTPSQNAESYFKKYNKQKRTLQAIAPQKETCETELKYLESIAEEISIAENVKDLECVVEELTDCKLIKSQPQKNKKSNKVFFRNFEIDKTVVKVGRNNTENDKLLALAKPEDIWLHAKDYHSSFVIIETGGKSVSQGVILTSAEICAYYSGGRDGGKVEVVWTKRKHVKKPPKSKPGFVIYENFKSVVVKALNHKEFEKQNG